MTNDRQIDKDKMLTTAAYGVHRSIEKKLNIVMSSLGIQTFYFYEYFLCNPMLKTEEKIDDHLDVIVPFLSRIISNQDFIPKIKDNNELTKEVKNILYNSIGGKNPLWEISSYPKNDDIINSSWVDNHVPNILNKSIFLQNLNDSWKNEEINYTAENNCIIKHIGDEGNWPQKKIRKEDDIVIIEGVLNPNYYRTIGNGKNFLSDIRKLAKGENGGNEEGAVGLLKEFLVSIQPWINIKAKDGEESSAYVIAMSISSKNIFWGEILIVISTRDAKIKIHNNKYEFIDENKHDKILLSIEDKIKKEIKDLYLPMLTLFENYWCEKLLSGEYKSIDEKCREENGGREECNDNDKYKKINIIKEDNQFCIKDNNDNKHRIIFLDESLKSSNHIIEQKLYYLWHDRKAKLDMNCKHNEINKGLLFAKYLIASPGMINNIKDVMSFSHKSPKDGEPLPSTLIVGGPGSGKDKMARIVKLFSKDYRFEEETVLNMAALKPKEFSTPLLMGMEANLSYDNYKQISLLSIFRKPNEEESSSISKEKDKKKGNGSKRVFILDELNSLDIDAQGAILRLLENGEIRSMGSLTEEYVDHLIIGVMNEEPDLIHKKKYLDRFLKDTEVFGGLVGDILYEHVRNMRRLREDLYFRLKRGGEIIIPALKDRREDIPILFYFLVNKGEMDSSLQDYKDKSEDQEIDVDFNLVVDLPAYDLLMDEALPWNGNIRELQTVSKLVVQEAKKHIKVKDKNNGHNEYEKDSTLQWGNNKISNNERDNNYTMDFFIRTRHVKKALEDYQSKYN